MFAGTVVAVVLLVAVALYARHGYRQMKVGNAQKAAVLRAYVGQSVTITVPSGLKGEFLVQRSGVVGSVDEREVVLLLDGGVPTSVPLSAVLGVADETGRVIADGW